VLSVFGADAKLWCTTIAARLAERIPQAYSDITPGRRGKAAVGRRRGRQERA
jgi:hypothetical protein